MTVRLLLVDDNVALLAAYRIAAESPIEIVTVTTIEAARAELLGQDFDWVVCDWRLAKGRTCALLVQELHTNGTPVAIITADPTAVTCSSEIPVLEKPLPLAGIVAALRGLGGDD